MADLTPDEQRALLRIGNEYGHVITEYEVAIWRAARAYQAEQDATKLEMSNDQILLMAGEMTAGEMRAVQAVLKSRAAAIRRGGQ